MFKLPPGPSAYFDIDSTLLEWDFPENINVSDIVEIEVRNIKSTFYINKYNLEYLKKLAKRGHAIVIWSAGGSDWAEAVANALQITDLVSAVLAKPTYFVDDIPDANKFMGKHVFYDINGNRHGFTPENTGVIKDK